MLKIRKDEKQAVTLDERMLKTVFGKSKKLANLSEVFAEGLKK